MGATDATLTPASWGYHIYEKQSLMAECVKNNLGTEGLLQKAVKFLWYAYMPTSELNFEGPSSNATIL